MPRFYFPTQFAVIWSHWIDLKWPVKHFIYYFVQNSYFKDFLCCSLWENCFSACPWVLSNLVELGDDSVWILITNDRILLSTKEVERHESCDFLIKTFFLDFQDTYRSQNPAVLASEKNSSLTWCLLFTICPDFPIDVMWLQNIVKRHLLIISSFFSSCRLFRELFTCSVACVPVTHTLL